MISNQQLEQLLHEHARGSECGLWELKTPAMPVAVAEREANRSRAWWLAAAVCAAVAVAGWLTLLDSPKQVARVESPETKPSVAVEPRTKPRVRDISFDSVKFPLGKGEPFDQELLTPEITELDGAPVRIRGYMLPHYVSSGIKRFVLVRDNQECCFGPGAALYDCMLVDLADGRSTDYRVHPITIEGRLEIRPEGDDPSQPMVLYHLVDGRVR